MLNLVLKRKRRKKKEFRPIIKYLSPVGKSDHVLIEVELQGWALVRREEDYKNGRLNYARANFEDLKEFFFLSIDSRGIMSNGT